MGLNRGEQLAIYFVVGVILFLFVAAVAIVYECIKYKVKHSHSSKASYTKFKKEPHPSSWKMCPNCVIEIPVITEQPVTISDNTALDNPQASNEVPVIAVEDTNTAENLNSNDFGLSDDTSQVNLLAKNKPTFEVHVDTVA